MGTDSNEVHLNYEWSVKTLSSVSDKDDMHQIAPFCIFVINKIQKYYFSVRCESYGMTLTVLGL